MIWINTEDVIWIHNRIIEKTKGIEGIRDLHGLEAAIAAPLQTFGGQDLFPTDIEKIAPVEVKTGNYRSHSSLDKFRKHFSSVIGNSYILYTKDVMIKDGIIHLPLYMAELL